MLWSPGGPIEIDEQCEALSLLGDIAVGDHLNVDFGCDTGGRQVIGRSGCEEAGEGEEAGKDVAMQIAAMNPIAIDADGIAPELIAREKDIAIEQGLSVGVMARRLVPEGCPCQTEA